MITIYSVVWGVEWKPGLRGIIKPSYEGALCGDKTLSGRGSQTLKERFPPQFVTMDLSTLVLCYLGYFTNPRLDDAGKASPVTSQ